MAAAIAVMDDVGWDLLPGQDVAVRYYEPDGDTVINVFQVPAPHLRGRTLDELGQQ